MLLPVQIICMTYFSLRCASSIYREKETEFILSAVIKVLPAVADGKVHTRARDKEHIISTKQEKRQCVRISKGEQTLTAAEAWSEN